MTPALRLADAEATRALGRALGATAEPGDVVALHGDLGVGKTTLAQGLAEGLEVPADHYVNSPTFTILQVHPGRLIFYHVDLYRIGDPDEALGLGLEEVVGTDGVAAVEWPERLTDLLPADHLRIELAHAGPAREARISALGAGARRWLEAAHLAPPA